MKEKVSLQKYYKFKLSGGFSSGIETANFIAKLANLYKKNKLIRGLTVDIVSPVRSHDFLEEIKRVFCWVKNYIRYVRDIVGVETVQIPLVTLPPKYSDIGIGAGDCDDQVLLLASMLLSIGVRNISTRIVTYKSTDKEYKHIYLIVEHNGVVYSLDPIAKDKPFGYEVAYYSKQDIKI